MVATRVIVWVMLCLSFIVNSMVLTNINIAILSMVKYNNSGNSDTSVINLAVCCKRTNCTSMNPEFSIKHEHVPQSSTVQWTITEQNSILGASYWFISVAQFFGGLLSHRFGPRLVMGYCTFFSGIMSSLIPTFSYISPVYVMWLRAFQGLISGLALPVTAFGIIGKWSPPQERGKFVTCFLAMPLGIAISYVFFGFVAEYLGWVYVFHTTLFFTTMWFIIWLYAVYDSPNKHPRISEKEKNFISSSIGNEVSAKKLPVPWFFILTSVPFWICVLCNFGAVWSYVTINMYGPAYFKSLFGYSTAKNGVITGTPYVWKAILVYVAGVMSDLFLRKNLLSVTNCRKFSTVFGNVVSGACLLGVAYADCSASVATLALTASVALSGFANSGPNAAFIDMSPNFCEVLQGINGTISFTSAFFCTLLVDFVAVRYDVYIQWQIVFLVAAITSILPGVIFILFGNAKLQSWNMPKERKTFEHLEANTSLKTPNDPLLS